MGDPVPDEFFKLDKPWFNVVSKGCLKGVKESYNVNVVNAVEDMSNTHMQQCIDQANLIIPELKVVLDRRRRNYGISDDFTVEYP